MNRYVVERSFDRGLDVPATSQGADACAAIIATNAAEGVTWIVSYVSVDKSKTFCLYEGPSPDAVRLVAERNGLPVDRITRIRVLDPYFNY